MSKSTRLWIIGSALLAIAAIIILSAGISQLEFSPGKLYRVPPREGENYLPDDSAAELFNQIASNRSMLVIILSAIVILSVIILLILDSESRKRALRTLVQVLVSALAVYVVVTRLPAGCSLNTASEPTSSGGVAIPEFSPVTPVWLTYITSYIAVVLFVGAIWLVWRKMGKRESTKEQIIWEAKSTLEELREGRDFRNAILRCYYEMSNSLKKQRGIERKKTMTAREFEKRLVEAKFPEGPVKRLTRLFEDVRYGAIEPTKKDEQQAISCLTEIVEASHRRS